MEKRGIHMGDSHRLRKVILKAEKGDNVVLAFLGGSITQGSLSSTPKTCYAYLVYQWWVKTFPNTTFTYINAGIGGTSSLFGVSRCQEDVLKYEPDLVIVDFTVNDENTDFFLETYESLIRRLLKASPDLAVLALCNVSYSDGKSAFERHKRVLKHYGIPYVSMKETLYQDICDGKVLCETVTSDGLHPNDLGHQIIAGEITKLLWEVPFAESEDKNSIPITQCCYEEANRIQKPSGAVWCNGFTADDREKNGVTDVFKRGWIGYKKGDRIRIVANGSSLAIQYRKTVARPAPVAVAYIDGDFEHGITLDGNFDQDWGDCLEATSLLYHGDKGVHKIDIVITQGVEKQNTPFYLAAVIHSGNR